MWLHIRNECAKMMWKEERKMKKNDWVLTVFILLIAVVGMILYTNLGKQGGEFVLVTVDGEVFGTYSLQKDKKIPINKTNVLTIKDGIADMTEGDCPDQICVEHKPISKNRETIVCLPNKVIVEIVGGKNADMDAVSK